MNSNDKIYVAGHNGMVGSALVRALKERGNNNLILKSHKELDLTIQSDVVNFFKEEKRPVILIGFFVFLNEINNLSKRKKTVAVFLQKNA